MVKPFTIKNGNLIICKLSNYHTKGARDLFPDALPQSSVLSARIAFSIAITETPTSANTASHIFAIPAAPSMRTRALTARAKHDVLFYNLKRLSGNLDYSGNLAGLSSIRTTSAASMARQNHASHGDSDIGPGQYRCIVDSVTDKSQFALLIQRL